MLKLALPGRPPQYSALYGPAAIPIASLAVTAIGAGVSAVGAIQQSNATAAQARYQAQVARNNSIMAERAAKDAEARGRTAEYNSRIATKRLIGRQRAILAANGVLLDNGSPSDIVADTTALGEVDALTERQNAQREALNYRQQGANFDASAQLYKSQARSAAGSAPWEVTGTVLNGIGSVADKWYSFKKEGVW